MNTQRTTLAVAALLVLVGALLALRLTTNDESLAQGNLYDLSWWTVDGGGGMLSGESYSLAGTIGQPDAGPALGGGGYTLGGAFGPGSPPQARLWSASSIYRCCCGPDHSTEATGYLRHAPPT